MGIANPQRDREVFEAAAALDKAARGAMLDAAFADDLQGRQRLERLLSAHDHSSNFINTQAAETLEHLSEKEPGEHMLGRRIGQYTILEVIASGGMGVVYKARQDQPQRIVALKVIRPGFLAPSLVRRFKHEAHVLGQLQHPGIAQIFEAGTFDVGFSAQPFFAMEYIEGQMVLEYAEARRLDLCDRLELLARVCDAVHHAHQKGVIHRDLKPGNILVSTESREKGPDEAAAHPSSLQPAALGQPKILDFGVARVVDSSVSERSLQTTVGQIIGTIPYMSPEQIAGRQDELDIRSDVYSLGVIGYELLCGRRPHDVDSKNPAEAARIIQQTEPARLSEVKRSLRGDPETIMGKALEKQRDRRYASAASLAEDLRRCLRNEPIVARPATAIYQLRKFASRHRAVVGGIAAVFIVLVAAVIVSTALMLEANRERDEARRNAYTADIAAAESAIRSNDVSYARNRLEQSPASLRQWEWRHLWARLDRSDQVLVSQQDNARCVVYAPNKDLLVVGGDDGTIMLWDLAAPRATLVATIADQTGQVNDLVFDRGGTRFATAHPRGSAKVYDLATRTVVLDMTGRVGNVRSVDFSPDGSTIATGTLAGKVQLWSSGDGSLLKSFQGHDQSAESVRFSPDGRMLATGSTDQSAVLWDVGTGQTIHRLLGHQARVSRVAFSPDGELLATSGFDRTIRIWNCRSGSTVATLIGHTSLVEGAVFSPDGQLIASASWDRTVRLWDTKSGLELSVLRGHATGLSSVVFSRDGGQIASGGRGDVRLWRIDANDVRTIRGTSWNSKVAFTSDSKFILTSMNEGVRMWNILIGEPSMDFLDRAEPTSIAASKDGLCAAGFVDGRIEVWNLETGESVSHLTGPSSLVASLVFHPRTGDLISAAAQVICVWNPRTGALLTSLPDHRAEVTAIGLNGDGSVMASASQDDTIRIWTTSDWKMQRMITTESLFGSLAISRDGRWVAAACADTTIQIWNAQTASLVGTLHGHAGASSALGFSPDGTRLASASEDFTVKLWTVPGGREVATFHGHTYATRGLHFSPDGLWLASGSSDHTVRLWDAPKR